MREQNPRKVEEEFEKLVSDCGATPKDVQVMVDKAKTTETTGIARQVWKAVRFAFKPKQVDYVRWWIVSQNETLLISLAALTEVRGAHIEQRLEDGHARVEKLVSSRAHVREALVVLEDEDQAVEQSQYTLNDRISRHRSTPSDQSPNKPDNEKSGELRTSQYTTTSVVELTLAQVLAKVEALSTSVEKLTQQKPPDNSDVIDLVLSATRPSADAQRALEMISEKYGR